MKPRSVDHLGPDLLRIVWKDDVTCDYTARALRLACPCAACVEEWTGRALLDPAAVPLFVTILAVQPVGRYALSFTFSDGHGTGIFSWERLRALGGGGSEAGRDP